VLERDSQKIVASGLITSSARLALPLRLKKIYNELKDIIEKYSPVELAIEEMFFALSKKTVSAFAQTRGVVLLLAAQYGLQVYEYNPKRVKIALTGYGSADKRQIQLMVQSFFQLAKTPTPDDLADALAIGLCHLNTKRFGNV